MIVGLERGRCRRIGFVLVAASGIVEQGGNDRQQHDHDDADNDATPVIKSWMMFMLQSWRAEL